MQALALLKQDIARLGVRLPARAWDDVARQCAPVEVPAGHILQSQARVPEAWIFVSAGVAASVQTWVDGETTIARFFEPGSICANITSAWTGDAGADDLVAITAVSGLSLPDSTFRHAYLHGEGFGTYLRLKMMEAHLFAKELVTAKTSGRLETRYGFLQSHQPGVLGVVPQKDIARFLGVTPQGLSRFLQRQKKRAD